MTIIAFKKSNFVKINGFHQF